MELSEFKIGESFECSDRVWLCTDIGTRTVVAIRTDRVEVVKGIFKETLNWEQAQREGWLDGPPYAIAEVVFDENDFAACEVYLTAETHSYSDLGRYEPRGQ